MSLAQKNKTAQKKILPFVTPRGWEGWEGRARQPKGHTDGEMSPYSQSTATERNMKEAPHHVISQGKIPKRHPS